MKPDAKRRAEPINAKAILDCIPESWLDPLLTGPKAVFNPIKGEGIELLLNAVRERVRSEIAKQNRRLARLSAIRERKA